MLIPTRVATALIALSTATAVCAGVVLHVVNRTAPVATGVTDWWLMGVAGAATFGGTGAWLTWLRPRLNIGWLLLGIGAVSGLSLAALEYGIWALQRGAEGAAIALWVGNWAWVGAILPVGVVIPLLLPDGRLLSGHWRPVLAIAALAVVAETMMWALLPYDMSTPALHDAGLRNPFAVGALADPALQSLVTTSLVLCPIIAMAGLILRWRRSPGVPRQQLKWILLGFTSALALFAAGFSVGPVMSALSMLPLPLAIVVAALKHGLWDVDLVISRSLVYAVLVLCVVGVYVAVVGVLGGLLGRTTGAPILATALVAVAVEPLHRRLRALVNRRMHGSDEDPLTHLARLGARLGSAQDPATVSEQLLPQLMASTAATLHLPYAGVELADGSVIAHGDRGERVERLPLRHGGSTVGSLVVTPPGNGLGRRERQRLAGLADQVGVAAHSLLLAHALRRSNEQLVVSREEERRRLYRELHDGLGPSLAALALNVEVARDLVHRDADRAAELLDRALPRLKGTVSDVRTVVLGLRPPTLDDLGLAAAVHELATGFAGPGFAVAVECHDDLSGLPAATEVATYRIVAEALTNASRHASASRVSVRLDRAGDEVHVSVVDDGTGLGPQRHEGVGLASMTGRATEAGGRLHLGPGHDGRGTAVRVVLPAVTP
jgi:two-component system, NarL family, sensor kinase